MVCVSQGEDLGLETGMNGFAKTGKVDGIDVIQFNLEYSNHQNLVQRARVFLCYALCAGFLLWNFTKQIF
jgi:hypothetical protein